MKKSLIILFAFALLSGCSSSEVHTAKFMGTPSSKITLDVAKVTIIDHTTVQPSDSPYNKYQLDPTIAQAVHQWLTDTVQAGGAMGEALVIIKDASLSGQALPMSQDLSDKWFKRQQAAKYTGHAAVSVEIQGRNAFAQAAAEATHTVTLSEDATGAERQSQYSTLLNGLMKDLAQNWDAGIHEHLQDFIMPGSR